MKYKSLFLLCYSILILMAANAQRYIVGTYNIRLDNAGDTGNLWVSRAPYVANLIRFHNFDVFGTQEGFKNQLDDISKALPYYDRYGKGREDGKEKGEHSAIFYKRDKFMLLNKGDFWLSQTPGIPSLGWDATCCNRICSWVYLKDKKSGTKFYFFSVHYDHQGVQARKESSNLILQKIKEIAGNEPAILAGDFNGDKNSDWYKTLEASPLLKDAFNEVAFPYVNNASFNGFKSTDGRTDIIDHIFITAQIKVDRWGLLTDTYHGKYPSDHFPVLAEIHLGK